MKHVETQRNFIQKQNMFKELIFFEDKTSLFVLIFDIFLEFNQLSHTLLFLKESDYLLIGL